MTTTLTSFESRLSILHVFTLSSEVGEYGGPAKVAHEISEELAKRGHNVKLISGTRNESARKTNDSLTIEVIKVRSFWKAHKLSSLISAKIIRKLVREIRQADLIHIHLGREMIPIIASIICLIHKKKYFLQTHGMCVPNSRIFIRLIDKLVMIHLINKSQKLIVLTDDEKLQMSQFRLKTLPIVVPNGIKEIKNVEQMQESETIQVIFCSRIHPQKGVFKFVEIAEIFHKDQMFSKKIYFRIYGPDSGLLTKLKIVMTSLDLPNLDKEIKPLSQEEVMTILSRSHILVLPSSRDLFPMIVLEALSVGVSVVVMPSCGFASELNKFDSNFVASSEDVRGIVFALRKQIQMGLRARSEVVAFAKENFGIELVVNKLEQLYFQSLC